MFLKHLNCLNYRNIAECDLQLSPKFNCFLGDNGMGKTNLLDVIYFLSITKSHLNPVDALLVRHDQPYLMIEGVYDNDGKEERIQVSVKPRVRKLVKRNGKPYTRMADHIGLIPIVLVSPTDQQLIAEGSDERRRFMDILISQCDVRYLTSLGRYNKVLKTRNELLRGISDGEMVEDADGVLDVLDGQLEEEGRYIYAKRIDFIEEFLPLFNKSYCEICSSRESVGMRYASHLANGDLTQLLGECRLRDKAIGYTTRGIHKDDLIMSINGYPIKSTGSQGQNKSFVVAMKLAQYQLLAHKRGVKPLLLLDDVFDRLDGNRVANIIRLVSGEEYGQIFITDTSRNHTEALVRETVDAEFSIFTVENGEIRGAK